jgi:hypothetical protein
MKQARMTSLNSISRSQQVTKKECRFLLNKSVPKVDVLMLRIFASRESKTRKLNPNEAAQIVIVEIQLRFDDDSSITA